MVRMLDGRRLIDVLASLSRVLRPGATATALLSLTPQDRQPDLPPLS